MSPEEIRLECLRIGSAANVAPGSLLCSDTELAGVVMGVKSPSVSPLRSHAANYVQAIDVSVEKPNAFSFVQAH
jgi:hypothetical protein